MFCSYSDDGIEVMNIFEKYALLQLKPTRSSMHLSIRSLKTCLSANHFLFECKYVADGYGKAGSRLANHVKHEGSPNA